MTNSKATELRAWAQGSLTLEAAVELLGRAQHGRLLYGPWVRRADTGRLWFDADLAAAESGRFSGGERRVLAIAASLTSGEHPVNLGDTVTGIDPETLRVVLTVLAHAGGLPSAAAPLDIDND